MIAYRTLDVLTKSLYCISVVVGSSLYGSPFNSIKSWFTAYPHEEVVYKEYQCNPQAPCPIIIDQTLNGTVTVSGWDKNNIALVATKKGKHEDDVRTLAMSSQKDPHALTITTGHAKGRKKPCSACEFDLEIFAPRKTSVTIDSINDVTVHEMHSPIDITTEKGAISANGINASITTHIDNKGTTVLEDIRGPIDATTVSGDIFVKNSYNSVLAHTDYGSIKVACCEAPSTSIIDLKTVSGGTIDLAIPDTTQATIIANTERGKITSTVPITLERHTTVLNTRTYKKMSKQVHGILGDKGDTEIKVSSSRGIRITPHERLT